MSTGQDRRETYPIHWIPTAPGIWHGYARGRFYKVSEVLHFMVWETGKDGLELECVAGHSCATRLSTWDEVDAAVDEHSATKRGHG